MRGYLFVKLRQKQITKYYKNKKSDKELLTTQSMCVILKT